MEAGDAAEWLLHAESDVRLIHAGWLREMVSHAIRPDVGTVGAKLLYEDETVQHRMPAGMSAPMGEVLSQ